MVVEFVLNSFILLLSEYMFFNKNKRMNNKNFETVLKYNTNTGCQKEINSSTLNEITVHQSINPDQLTPIYQTVIINM